MISDVITVAVVVVENIRRVVDSAVGVIFIRDIFNGYDVVTS